MEYNVPLYIHVNLARLNWKWQRTFALKKKNLTFFFRQGFIRAPAAAGGARTNNKFPCWLTLWGGGPRLFLTWREGRVCQGSGRRVAEVVLCAGGKCSTLLLLWTIFFWFRASKEAVWGLFTSFVQNLPSLCIQAVIFNPIQFLGISLLEERCVQIQALQHFSKGSRSQPVSFPQKDTTPLF